MPLLSAIAARTKAIEVGTGVIDMRYENPLYLAEEAAALDLIADGRTALGVSRGAPEIARRGWEAFGYRSEDPRGSDLARAHYERFLDAVAAVPMAEAAPLHSSTRRSSPRERRCPSSRTLRGCDAGSGTGQDPTPRRSRRHATASTS